ncbi:AfsR/SARP family transcriptional regulator [Nonomuraea sp. LPB2021202275-12-8]|uniref:AfsR/SARP family transcriptional regulator n=1 Tax=Nonomuraea sp. LPB2021202275-12-8 TaxID=3120159 RepID=UPI00300C5B8B
MAEFRLLGPMEISTAGGPLDPGPPQRRAVLAALLVDAGRPVSVERLIDRVWDGEPPPKARETLYAHITRVRAMRLGVARLPSGYVLDVDRNDVDLHRFRDLLDRAREPDVADAERVAMLRRAIHLWRGTPLAELPSQWASQVREGLIRQRIGALTLWARAETRLGRPDVVIDRLRDAVAEHPLAESLAGELIRALCLGGRTAEALDCYAMTRRHLIDELGAEPGPELRALHLAVLRGSVGRPEAAPGAARAVPAQLPADVPAFTGRAVELSELSELLIGPGRESAVVITALSGTAGVGKTALAVRWAHQAREAFPGGQLYVNLRGYDPEQPVAPADALAGFLAALGVSGQEIPLDLEERAARYRTELSGRRVLIVLDNASSVEQVRPLLPGTPACAVLVTSRDSLAGLVAVHGAHRLTIGALPPADAIALLGTLIGRRAGAAPEAVAVLAEQCARLPLALRVAAELAVARPADSLRALVEELADHRRRLDLLDAGGDSRAAVRAVFSWSYQRLPAAVGRAFCLLGLHPGPHFDVQAAAALAGEPPARVRPVLDHLARAHLIQPARTGRYAMHDLLRAYAIWRADAQIKDLDQEAARGRLLDHYLSAAGVAVDSLYPENPAPAERLTSADALAWLDTERPVLLAVAARARSVRLAMTLHRYLESGGHFAEALLLHTRAHQAARQAGDPRGEADVLTCLGVIHRRLAQYADAATHHHSALALYRRIGDRIGEARSLTNIGIVHELRGRYDQAAGHHELAVTLFREGGDGVGEADALNNLGIVRELLNDYTGSAAHHRQALALYRELGQRSGEAKALGNLGIVHARLGDPETAADHYRQALLIFRELGVRSGEAHALTNLGDAHTRLGRYEAAADHQRRALDLFRRIGERYGEAGALNGLGEALAGGGQAGEAIATHAAALTLAGEISEHEEQARAHLGLAEIHQAAGRPGEAREHWAGALAIYTAIGSPHAAAVRDRLAALDG